MKFQWIQLLCYLTVSVKWKKNLLRSLNIITTPMRDNINLIFRNVRKAYRYIFTALMKNNRNLTFWNVLHNTNFYVLLEFLLMGRSVGMCGQLEIKFEKNILIDCKKYRSNLGEKSNKSPYKFKVNWYERISKTFTKRFELKVKLNKII